MNKILLTFFVVTTTFLTWTSAEAGKTITLESGAYKLTGTLCLPKGVGPFAAVVYHHGGMGDRVGGAPKATCNALAEAGFVGLSLIRRPCIRQIAGSVRPDVWDQDEPAPIFGMDPLEADMMTALLELTDPASLGKAMVKSEHEAETVVEHLPHFRRKWTEVRKAHWAQIFIMEPPEIVDTAVESD